MQGIGSRGSCRGGLCETRWGAALCWMQPFPAGLATDSQQVKAAAIGNVVCGTSVKMYLRKHKKCCRGTERGNKKSEKHQRKHQGQRRRRKRHPTVLEQIFPAACGKARVREDFTDRNCSLWRIHARSEEKGMEEEMAKRKPLYTEYNTPLCAHLHPSRAGQRSRV